MNFPGPQFPCPTVAFPTRPRFLLGPAKQVPSHARLFCAGERPQLLLGLGQPGASEPRRGIGARQPSKRLVISTAEWVALAVAPQALRDLHYARAVPLK